MHIRVINDGGTHVEVLNPAGERVGDLKTVELDHQLNIVLTDAHDASGIQVNEPEVLDKPTEDSKPDEAPEAPADA